jgi:hypothetical protein
LYHNYPTLARPYAALRLIPLVQFLRLVIVRLKLVVLVVLIVIPEVVIAQVNGAFRVGLLLLELQEVCRRAASQTQDEDDGQCEFVRGLVLPNSQEPFMTSSWRGRR